MASVGFIEGVAEATASFLKTFSGAWSDKSEKRKPFVCWGYFFAAVAKPLIALATHWGWVLGARSLDRFGKGLRSAPRDALLSESVDASQRGAAFGWHRFMDTLGAVIGPLLALLFLKWEPTGLRTVFFWAFIPGLVAVFISLAIPETKPSPHLERTKRGKGLWKEMPLPFRRYLFTWLIFSLSNSSDVFLLLRAKEKGASLTSVILLYCLYNWTYAFLSPFLGQLSDKIGRKKCLVFGLLVFALVYLGFSFASELWQFGLLFAVYGFYMAATDGVGKAFAVDLVDPKHKATALGFLGTVTGVAALVASSVAGLLWDQFGPAAPFLFGASGSLLALVLLGRTQFKALTDSSIV